MINKIKFYRLKCKETNKYVSCNNIDYMQGWSLSWDLDDEGHVFTSLDGKPESILEHTRLFEKCGHWDEDSCQIRVEPYFGDEDYRYYTKEELLEAYNIEEVDSSLVEFFIFPYMK